ncbi:MAG: D amino acid oxidase (DAO) family protein [Parcubacteria group bacterium GW2011_GWA1_36_12]|nr:MAG: D amino acid oxidase (DAO) family protein [Parcubacteria group bacterium GW2011_GWA1_36_12]
MSKIAVIGAGLFGISAALELSKKHSVDLWEKESDILHAASGINQFRLHRGYHYPRSENTVVSSLGAQRSFMRDFGESVRTNTQNYYCVASKNSKTSAENYIKFCKRNKLEFNYSKLNLINDKYVDLCIHVNERIIDSKKLNLICHHKLKNSKVNLLLSSEADPSIFKHYDYVINSTYANINSLVPLKKQRDYQFELCEKIVIKLPSEFKNKSIVILDGPFMCVDPYGSTGLYLMGNVVHAIRQSNIGKYPKIDNKYKKYVNQGIVRKSPTNFKKFIESTKKFIPLIENAKYVGSMYTVRTVLPHKNKTDERPTIVRKINEKVITIFSGKLGNCVQAAYEVREMIDNYSI